MTTYRRLSPSELESLGLSRKSRRYVRASTSNVSKRTATITARQYENQRFKKATGGTIKTKEAATKALRSGEISYKNYHTATIEKFKQRNREIRKQVGEIPIKFLRLIDKKRAIGWNELSDEEHEEWQEMFAEYAATKSDRFNFLRGIGSNVTLMRAA